VTTDIKPTTRLDALIEEQEAIFLARQPRSLELLERARKSLAGGVTSNWQIARPQVVWLSHAKGSKVYDADGNEYSDFHGGYGAMAVGHAHPKIVAAVTERVAQGTHFAQPTEDSIVVAEELASRFGLPQWRFGNSGTEATMDAFHLMRAASGRDCVVKIEGAYHGHHDSAMVSVAGSEDEIGPPAYPLSPAAGSGLPRALLDLTLVVPFNDLDALDRLLSQRASEIAGLIMEPIMMGAGIILPEDGYLEGVREITRRYGVLLAFDEVKTGFTTAPGGGTRLFGVTPDIICLAKSMGGGLPCGALGGSAEVMELIADGRYEQVGTFNGNPLTMAASRAALTRVLTSDVYARWDGLRERLVDSCSEVIARCGLPAHVVAVGSKGCITFSETPVRNYRDFLSIDDRFSHCHWLYQHNGGVFLPPWGKAEQFSFSAQHDESDADRFVSNFERFAEALRA
jgi:glutamate-1-semialdehyde 2,1-aminomutase